MADRACASMIIGGRIHSMLVPLLIKAIAEDHGRADWEGESVDEAMIVNGQTLEIHAYELIGGMFEVVESFCRQNHLPYVRSSASCNGVFGPERVIYTGEGQPAHFELTESDEVVITRNDLLTLGSIDAAEAWFAAADFAPPPFSIDGGQAVASADLQEVP